LPALTGLALAAGLGAGLSASPAAAAPQVLGLVADNGFATPLNCDGFECSAQFSSFCLQEARSSPATGTVYTPASGGDVSLVATAPDGTSLRLPSANLRITTAIGFTSVTMSLPQSKREVIARDLGVAPGEVALSVEVGTGVSLIPEVVAGDPDPQTAAEIALATGPLRSAGGRLFDGSSEQADAARLTTVLINRLPSRGRESAEDRASLFDQVAALPAASALSPDGVERARAVFAECRISVESSSMFSMRECLRLRHADLMVRSNRKFWNETGGS
jgi:hypothetical protein